MLAQTGGDDAPSCMAPVLRPRGRLGRAVARGGSLVVLALALPWSSAHARTLIQNEGSDSLAIAVQAWADAYRRVDPGTGIAVNAGGSGTGIAALINGTADIANSSRPMSAAERRRARELGREPVEHIVAHDLVGVLVNRDNPIGALDLVQLRQIFGRGGTVETWVELGAKVPGCKDQRIVRVGRLNSSGTHAYFRAAALGREKYRQGILAVRGSRQVVDLVASTPCAVGYSSLAYLTAKVRALCLAAEAGGDCVEPGAASARDGRYALTRPMYMYTSTAASAEVEGYLRWLLGDAGQCIIARRGYLSVRPVECPN